MDVNLLYNDIRLRKKNTHTKLYVGEGLINKQNTLKQELFLQLFTQKKKYFCSFDKCFIRKNRHPLKTMFT
jgi:hypothetical protein